MAPPHKCFKTCTEEVKPLSTWQAMVEWRESEPGGGGGGQVRKLRPRVPSSNPRTLLCHDMKGGYLDDRFVSGCSNKDAYRFYHWSGVDTFVYFSHHLVTIPPPGWINAAHLHGVTVLGTFITEWEAGKEVCKELLASEETVATAVKQLVRIANYHGFEGWLINIENEVPTEKIPLMVKFVKDLTRSMKNTHFDRKAEKVKDNEVKEQSTDDCHCVIWYDSVTEDGKLEWQNELSPLNRVFFDACNGIFLNYTWSEAHLDRTKEAAQGRARDVFVGLDVFGRNFYAGGKYDTWKALEVVRKFGLSAAIFAQGWTYETQTDFVEAERRVWGSLAPFLTQRGCQELPFTTSFCQGFGEHLYSRGKVEREGPWHNLSHQHLQPLWSQAAEEEGSHCLSLVTHEAYNGGGCLGITTHSSTSFRLVVCGLEWTGTLTVSVAYKWCSSPTSLSFLCHVSGGESSGQHSILEFVCEEDKEEHGKKEDKHECEDEKMIVCPLVDSHIENGWSMRSFKVKAMPGLKMTQVTLRLGSAAELRLGHLEITNACPSEPQVEETGKD